MATEPTGDQIREAVRERYAEAAKRAQGQQGASCCASSCCGDISSEISTGLYEQSELRGVPEGAVLASLGCGNPTLLAELKPGETVLDLGSGGGIDVLLSARRVGPTGKAYGLDMTDEMLDLARSNARQAGVSNVEFLKGNIEAIPLPDDTVDVIISNCVINLSPDKDAVLQEAYRVLKPGGRFAVADIVVQGGPLPEAVRRMLSLWAGCVSGALTEDEYRQKLAMSGFTDIDLQVLKDYGIEDVPEEMRSALPAGLELEAGTKIVSAFVRATKADAAQRPTETATSATGSQPATGCCGSGD